MNKDIKDIIELIDGMRQEWSDVGDVEMKDALGGNEELFETANEHNGGAIFGAQLMHILQEKYGE